MAASSKKPSPAKKSASKAAKPAPAKKASPAKKAAKSPARPAAKKAPSKAVKATPKKVESVKVSKAPKPAAKKAPVPKAKPAPKAAKKVAAKAAPKKPVAKKPALTPSKPKSKRTTEVKELKVKVVKNSPAFLAKQRQRLLMLKDTLLDSMNGVAKDTLRSRAEGSEGSAFGMHQADAGSDAYDRDFALNLLSLEQNSLYEIDQALKRVEDGSYGVCEISGKPIPHIRLEALPFTRYTVECQAELEKQNRFRARVPVTSLFGLSDDDDSDDDDSGSDGKD